MIDVCYLLCEKLVSRVKKNKYSHEILDCTVRNIHENRSKPFYFCNVTFLNETGYSMSKKKYI